MRMPALRAWRANTLALLPSFGLTAFPTSISSFIYYAAVRLVNGHHEASIVLILGDAGIVSQ